VELIYECSGDKAGLVKLGFHSENIILEKMKTYNFGTGIFIRNSFLFARLLMGK
jgi:hypothetical protein